MLPKWTEITLADLQDAKLGPLVAALQTAALAEGQTDPTPRIIQDVVDLIRRKIASNPSNRVDDDETKVPRGLKTDAVSLILARMKGRLELALTEDEANEKKRIEKDLDRIAEGKDTVEQPDIPVESPSQTTGGRPRTKPRKRRFDRNNDADGL